MATIREQELRAKRLVEQADRLLKALPVDVSNVPQRDPLLPPWKGRPVVFVEAVNTQDQLDEARKQMVAADKLKMWGETKEEDGHDGESMIRRVAEFLKEL
jgi:hypothetical protein